MKEKELKNYIESITQIKDEYWESLQEKSSLLFLEKGELFARAGEQVKKIGFLNSGIVRIFYLDEI